MLVYGELVAPDLKFLWQEAFINFTHTMRELGSDRGYHVLVRKVSHVQL